MSWAPEATDHPATPWRAISGITLGLLVPLVAQAQQPSKVPRVGVIGESSPADPFLAAFRQGLRELGYTEGQSIAIEYRYAYGVLAGLPGSRLKSSASRLMY